jgi:hypothetical protein
MPTSGKRTERSKGYLHAAGPQYRFILFLIFLLIAYTLLLRVFQKLAEILQFPVFLPLSLFSLLIFVGIVGTLYSHTFVGPLSRIRRALDQLAQGETGITLRLRESDDPLLKDIAGVINRLCEHSRNTQATVRELAGDVLREAETLQSKIAAHAAEGDIQKQLAILREKQRLLDEAIKASARA